MMWYFALCLLVLISADVKVIPYPKLITTGKESMTIGSCGLQIQYESSLADSFKQLMAIHKSLLMPQDTECAHWTNPERYTVTVQQKAAEAGNLECTSEAYELDVTQKSATLRAECPVGLVHGIVTLWQLLKIDDGTGATVRASSRTTTTLSELPIHIEDAPRFAYRGLMIDTSRHYLQLATIKRVINGLMLAKLSVLHWHLVDDDSFPMQSAHIPGLAESAAFTPQMIYTVAQIKEIVEYAKQRGIRVVPEIDCPGHSLAVGKYKPLNELVTCFDSVFPYRVPNVYRIHGGPGSGALDPTMDSTYEYAKNMLLDLQDYFTDQLIHLGGDEVIFSCWKARKSIEDFMKQHNIPDFQHLMIYFIERMRALLTHLNPSKKVMYWSDPSTFDIKYQAGDVLQYWGLSGSMSKLKDLYPHNSFVLSPNDYLYLDGGLGNKYGGPMWCGDYKTWLKLYRFEPTNFQIPEAQIMGAEACAWGEMNTDFDIELRLWPRMAAFAETLWMPKRTQEIDLVSLVTRLNAFSTRLNTEGIPSNAVARQYCEIHAQECFQKW